MPEVGAGDPHAVEHDGDLAGDGDDGSSAALGLHEPDTQAFTLDQVIERISMALAAA